MYLSDVHTHSIASGHGTTCTVSDMAKAASKKGLKLLGITDHGPGTLAAGTSSYFRSLSYSPKKRFGIELLFGVELNILDVDGHVDLSDELLDKLEFGVIFEINEASLAPYGYRGDTRANNREILRCCRKYNIPIVLSSDSHGTEHIGDFTCAAEFVHEEMFPEELILNNQIPRLKMILEER